MVARVKAVSAATVRDGIEVVRALAAYRATVVPVVREGLRGWERVAETIPDPVLREQALFSVREKGLNAEATAVFGILAPRRRRRQAVEAMTAFQVAVDYLDTLGEQPADDPLANGLRLHGRWSRRWRRMAKPVVAAARRPLWHVADPRAPGASGTRYIAVATTAATWLP